VAGKVTIAIIGGTGALGAGLGRRLAAAGHAVVIGSRSAAKAEAAANALAANATGSRPRGTGNAEAAKSGDIVFVTVPWASHAAILDEIAPHVAGKLLVDTTVPLVPPRVARAQMPPEGSAALATQRRLGTGVRVVSAFHNVAAHKLQSACVRRRSEGSRGGGGSGARRGSARHPCRCARQLGGGRGPHIRAHRHQSCL
jgi:NADPH-dependent F420 reductase